MAKVVNFYKGLPNGAAPGGKATGYKARHFDGKNSDMTPVFQTIGAVFVLSYTIDYHFHLSKSTIKRSTLMVKMSERRACVCVSKDKKDDTMLGTTDFMMLI